MAHPTTRAGLVPCMALLAAALPAQGTSAPDVPPRASDVAMVADTIRDRVVLFGGQIELGEFRPDTWEWDGLAWQRRRLSLVPPPRIGHAMGFDPVRGEVVLFGGYLNTSPGMAGDTWTFDGFAWRQRVAAGPTARGRHAMAFDPVRGVVLLLGGQDATTGAILADQWSWDGSGWQLDAASPPALTEAAASCDPARARVVLFGGRSGRLPNDASRRTWEWDGTAWHDATPPSGPSPRYDVCLAYDAARARTVMTGGRNSADAPVAETWEWDGAIWRLRAPMPWPRSRHGSAWHAGSRRVVVGFGKGRYPVTDLGDLQSWDGAQWQQVHPARGSEFDGWNCRFTGLAFGGETLALGSRDYNDRTSWWLRWNGHSWQDRDTPGTAAMPNELQDAAIAVDEARQRVVRFGGRDTSQSPPVPTNETWTWDGTAWTRVGTVGHQPSARWGAALAWDPRRQTLVLFGGMGATGPLADPVWQWDGSTWSVVGTAYPPPPAAYEALMAFDPMSQRLMLCGGRTSASTWLTDTWMLNHNGSWTREHIGSTAQGWRLCGVHPTLDRVVRAGWHTGTGLASSQYWNGSTWIDTAWTSVPATSRVWGTGAPDPVRGALVAPHRADTMFTHWVATVEDEGAGCAFGEDEPRMDTGLAWFGCPSLPLDLSARPGTLVAMALSLTNWTSAPAPGCTALLQLDWLAVGVAGPTGFASVGIAVPDAQEIIGRSVHAQAATIGPAGFALSVRKQVRIGH